MDRSAEPVITLVPARRDDLPLLARLNAELIAAEASANPMSLDQLAARFADWLAGDWLVLLIQVDGEPAGYTVAQMRTDPYQPTRPLAFVRHFMLSERYRGRGLGRRAFEILVDQHLGRESLLELQVLASNPSGAAFWSSLGFAPYATTLHRLPG